MIRRAGRVAPLQAWLVILLCFVSAVAAKHVSEQGGLNPSDVPRHDKETVLGQQGPNDDSYIEAPLAHNVQEAMTILRGINLPSTSKLSRTSRKPKGVMGTVVYYAKEVFVLLFMNAPQQTSTLGDSNSHQHPKLSQPLAKAVRLLEEAAIEYNEDAMFLLAEMNFHGNYTHPINYNEAFRWYEDLAGFDGNSTAQYMLGFMYATGLNPLVPADQAKSMLYHTFAAEQGNTRSEMTLAYRHHAGIATPRNCEEAVHWYKRVADKAIRHYRSGPPGGYSLVRDVYRIADEDGGVYGEGASVSSSGYNAKVGGPTSDAYAEMEDVLEYLYLQSSKGDLRAKFSLARLYYDGSRGLKPDWNLAKDYFLSIARENWPREGKVSKKIPPTTEKLASKAAGYLGRMFLRGEGLAQDFAKARIWLTRGVSNGDALSQYSLGIMYLEGLGVKQDAFKAGELFSAAADQDLAVAQTNLGMLFLDQGDPVTAGNYFDLAARNSHIEAFYYLAELQHQGIGRDRSCGMAATYYKIVAEKAEAIWGSLGEANAAYDDGDIQSAVLGYLMAAEQGSEAAQANVAWLLDQAQPRWSAIAWLTSLSKSVGTTVADATLALMYWTRSAKQHNVDSLVKMGDYYLDGLGTVASAENAAACYQAASDTLQSAQAMWNLGWMHENGVGIAKDFHLAKRYYDQALETNREAYLPVQISLFRLRWRSWWNDVTHGGINGIKPDESTRRPRSFTEWLQEFLAADAALYEQYGHDDWDSDQDIMPGGDDYWDGGDGTDDYDDGVVETLLVGGLVAVLAWLIYYRQQQQQRVAQERRRREEQQQQQQHPQGNAGAVGGAGAAPAPAAAVPGQQADGGFFPQPGDANFGAWIAGGIGH